jgi:hypothetical protein
MPRKADLLLSGQAVVIRLPGVDISEVELQFKVARPQTRRKSLKLQERCDEMRARMNRPKKEARVKRPKLSRESLRALVRTPAPKITRPRVPLTIAPPKIRLEHEKVSVDRKLAAAALTKPAFSLRDLYPVWRPTLPIVSLASTSEQFKKDFARDHKRETKGDPILTDSTKEVFTPSEAAARQLERDGVNDRAREREQRLERDMQRRRVQYA